MKTRIALLAASALGVFALAMPASEAAAADVPALLKKAKCYACHDAEKTLLGPSYRAIALRHAENKDAMVEALTQKIVLGGGGNWGVVPMAPNEQVGEDEAREMALWILERDVISGNRF